MTDIIVGIDLGTTNSEIAVIENGQPTIITDNNGIAMLPSFVGFSPEGELLLGEPARNQYVAFPERTVKSIKRLMGSDQTITLADQDYTPQEISAMLLVQLKTLAEAHLQQPVSKAVITVPAFFNDAQRQATREAGELAGLEVVRIINEPTAAALSYNTRQSGGLKTLVYDLGGGTFDVSVVHIQEDVVEVLASHGNNQLGGDDFDAAIVAFLSAHLRKEHQLDVETTTDSTQVKARLLRAAIEAKLTLSSQPFATISEEFLASVDGIPINLSVELSRQTYEDMILPLVDETLDAVHTALSGANMTATDIDEILLVGGSTRTPLAAQMLAAEIGLAPRSEVDPDLCVATGAALQAGMMAGKNVSSVLVDVSPYTFGTSVFGDLNGLHYAYVYAPIIAKNTPIPVSKSEVFYTVEKNQKQVEVEIYQGENPDARKNTLIGDFIIKGLSKAPERSPIVMQLSLDINGQLSVTATEKNTGVQKSIAIDNVIPRMAVNEVETARQRVGALLGDTRENRLVSEARLLIEKVEFLLDKVLPEDREDMQKLIATIQQASSDNNLETLQQASEQLNDILYYLEA